MMALRKGNLLHTMGYSGQLSRLMSEVFVRRGGGVGQGTLPNATRVFMEVSS